MNLLFPLVMRVNDQLVRVTVVPDGRENLEALRSGRAILAPSHPTETEPVVLAWMARRVGRVFHYAATHEIFVGWRGWLVNQMGAFSILRGRADLSAARAARHLLADLDRILVMFPEGEHHMQSDLVLPLKPGAVQFGFWALARLERLAKPARCPLVPVAVKYRYVGNPRPALRAGLRRLEAHLGLGSDLRGPIPERLWRAGLAILTNIEREYGIPDATGRSADDRIAALANFISGRVSGALNIREPSATGIPIKMRALFNATFDYLDALAEGESSFQRQLYGRRQLAVKACLKDLWRMQNFMTISEASLAPPITAERAGEVLWRLETEVYGKAHTRPLREALVRISQPIELSARIVEYHRAERPTVLTVTADLEERLRGIVHSLSPLGTPLE